MSHKSPSRESEKFVLRMPDGMRAWIADEARRNLRSANAQTIWMLQCQMAQTKTASESAATLAKASPEP